MNGLRRAVRWYDGCLTASPLRTKIATSVSILSFADVARQFWGEGHDTADTFDTERTMRMAAFGGMIHAPWIHYWFNFIERQLPALPAGSPRGKLAKMAVKKMILMMKLLRLLARKTKRLQKRAKRQRGVKRKRHRYDKKGLKQKNQDK